MNDFIFNIEDRGLQYLGARRIEGPLVVVERIRDVGYDEPVAPNALEVYVARLRGKLENSGIEIVTIRGLGYLLRLA